MSKGDTRRQRRSNNMEPAPSVPPLSPGAAAVERVIQAACAWCDINYEEYTTADATQDELHGAVAAYREHLRSQP